jgi:hypothetical protein
VGHDAPDSDFLYGALELIPGVAAQQRPDDARIFNFASRSR